MEMSELQQVIFLLKDLKKDSLKKRHWMIIFQELQIPGFHENFTLQDLQKHGIYSYNEKVRDIVDQAEKEHSQST
jgi:hypothetical protein